MKEAGPHGSIRFYHSRYPGSVAFFVGKRVQSIEGRIVRRYLPEFFNAFRYKVIFEISTVVFNNVFQDAIQLIQFFFVNEYLLLALVAPKHFAVERMAAHIGW